MYGSNDFDQFLVKWLGHDRSTATWETRFALRRIDCGSDAIQQYEQPDTTSHTIGNKSIPQSVSYPTQSQTKSQTQPDRVSISITSQPHHPPSTIIGSRSATHMPVPSQESPGVLNQKMETSNQTASTMTAKPQRPKRGLTIQPIDSALHQILASHETRQWAPTGIDTGQAFDNTNINNNNTPNSDNNSSNNLSKLRNKNNNLLEYTHIPAETQPSNPRLVQPRLRPVSIIQICKIFIYMFKTHLKCMHQEMCMKFV